MLKLAAQQLSDGVQLPVTSLFETLAMSRATYYRRLANPVPAGPDRELRDYIQRLALERPRCGYHSITAELHRLGMTANHKRVLQLMHEDNVLFLRKRRFISTTDSRHSLAIYPNLMPELTLLSINQLWVADITYIRLLREFIYLAVILDAYICRCIAWALEPYLEAKLAVGAPHLA
jgi:putative transposase